VEESQLRPVDSPVDALPFVDEDIGPSLFDTRPETKVINPSKAYFSALPSELKMEILDYFLEDCTITMGKGSWQESGRWLSPNKKNMDTLKAIRE
jgi:hypothetical protein